ncbi:hypothetical protein P4O66_002382 [Electrophorus voltai]|uniref:Alkylated DNA repair protein AlkB homologue 8 N-terminal domain-containing protein n=1 Tax=Electrophorus voltai TaxID=2609070 RepID=A0AAD8YZA2_9TELE|nr:hypothetical protein P4O66_002382 [Electrophorus voltai]
MRGAYLEEIKHLENWCQENNLLLNISKTKELIVDCSKKQEWHYQPVRISGTTVERVDSFRYLGVHILQDLSWSRHTNSLAKKARQHLYHLRRLRDFRLPSKVLRNFYTCTIESILTGNSTKQDRQALQRVVRSAERITHTELPDLQTIYYKRCQTKAGRIVKDPTHPNNRLFSLLRLTGTFVSDMTRCGFNALWVGISFFGPDGAHTQRPIMAEIKEMCEIPFEVSHAWRGRTVVERAGLHPDRIQSTPEALVSPYSTISL